ncbi:MAG: hypothetical protein KatS3mg059_1075 [Thermomicrobiales bacterium]|nr:MAG: hypothetical protein KatS3mg059_1075 [Thermomicrobiales bacterium]
MIGSAITAATVSGSSLTIASSIASTQARVQASRRAQAEQPGRFGGVTCRKPGAKGSNCATSTPPARRRPSRGPCRRGSSCTARSPCTSRGWPVWAWYCRAILIAASFASEPPVKNFTVVYCAGVIGNQQLGQAQRARTLVDIVGAVKAIVAHLLGGDRRRTAGCRAPG